MVSRIVLLVELIVIVVKRIIVIVCIAVLRFNDGAAGVADDVTAELAFR
jgi:hypothetical protein